MQKATLTFLIKKENNKISRICLAMKKRGFGKDKWNGFGGKVKTGETIRQTAIRETQEESTVTPLDLKKVAIFDFYFPDKLEWGQQVHAYFCNNWEGDIKETEEMRPKWFAVNQIPYDKMWADDQSWLPEALTGHLTRAEFIFFNSGKIKNKKINFVNSLFE